MADDLLVDEPQWVLDVWALEGNGRGGTLKHLHEQVVEEPDWGEDHMAQRAQLGPHGGAALRSLSRRRRLRCRRHLLPLRLRRLRRPWRRLRRLLRGASRSGETGESFPGAARIRSARRVCSSRPPVLSASSVPSADSGTSSNSCWGWRR